MPVQARIVRITKATSQFMITPPKRIFVFAQKLAAPKVPLRVSASDSPSMEQKPPIGSQLRLKTRLSCFLFQSVLGMRTHLVFFLPSTSTSCFTQAMARGGKPIPNSFTLTPLRRAIIKCPNSCATTSAIKIKSPMIIPKTIFITIIILRFTKKFIIIYRNGVRDYCIRQ